MMKPTKLAKLRRKAYRNAYVKSNVAQGLAFQIKALRISRGLTQSELARLLKLGGQSAVARIEDPSYGKTSVATLLKLGEFFDVALLTKFVSYSRYLVEFEDLSDRALAVESFEHEDEAGSLENAPEFRLIRSIKPQSTGPKIAVRTWAVTATAPQSQRPTALSYDGTSDSALKTTIFDLSSLRDRSHAA
ncbi:helix-turn-helix transcriptional regulator [Caballeronia glebae]|uniref:helix-turn-helix transcriptional regulator n=1 Tax=Caballeronia glebae TaxID=1777143 RepID=UPI0038BA49A3